MNSKHSFYNKFVNYIPFSQPLIWGGIISCFSSIISVLIWGFEFGISNNEFHTVIVYKISKGLNFSGDAMAESLKNFISPFWWVIGYLSQIIPPYAVFLLFFILSRFILNIGIALTIMALSFKKDSMLPWILSSCFTLSSGFIMGLPLGDDPVIGKYLSHTFFSIGICMISFALTLLGRYSWSALFLGIAYNINAMQANFLFGILIIVWTTNLSLNIQKSFLKMIKGVLTVFIIGLPTFLWIFSIFREPDNIMLSGSALTDFAKYYFPHHYFWSLKSFWQKSQGLSIPVLLFLLTFINIFVQKPFIKSHNQKSIFISSFILLGYIFVGIIILDYFPSRFSLQLHLFRSDVLSFTILISLLGAMFLNTLMYHELSNSAMMLLTSCVVLVHDFRLAVVILGIYFCYNLVTRYAQHKLFIKNLFYFCLLLISLLLIYKGKWEVFIFYISTLSFIMIREYFSRIARIILIIPAFLLFLFSNVQYYYKLPKQTEYKINSKQIDHIAQIAQQVTPSDALFLIPPIYSCRSYLQRGVYVSMRDGAAYLWQKGYELKFLRRLAILGIVYTPGMEFQREQVYKEFMENLYVSIPKLKLEGVTHVILPKRDNCNQKFKLIVEDKDFCLMTIDNALGYIGDSPIAK